MSKPFADVIRDYRKGALHDKLTDDLAELILAVIAAGEKGKLKIEITATPNSDQIKLSVKTKLEKPDAVVIGEAIFFPDEDGGLHRSDPRQGDLPLVSEATSKKPAAH